LTNSFTSDKIAELVMGLKKLIPKNKLKKFLTKANEFDKINELLIERTAKKLKKLQKNKSKKFLTNEKLCGKINELIRVGMAKILDN
jgi:hypothetical protein